MRAALSAGHVPLGAAGAGRRGGARPLCPGPTRTRTAPRAPRAQVTLFDDACKPVYDLGGGPYNTVLWNPFGRFLAIAGFGNLPGARARPRRPRERVWGACRPRPTRSRRPRAAPPYPARAPQATSFSG